LSAGPGEIARALTAQRQRFLTYLRGLDPTAWAEPTRCHTWSVQHVARHMVDTARIDAARLAGRPPVFPVDQPFDPTLTPDEWLRYTDDQSPGETLAALADAVTDEATSLQRRTEEGEMDCLEGPSGRPVHWSLIPLHMFWDGWLHERDVLLPRNDIQQSTVEELRFAAMYGLMTAAIPPILVGNPVETTVALAGAPDRLYRIAAGEDEVIVAAEDDGEPCIIGDLERAIDALMGRGATVQDVLVGDPQEIEKLSWLSSFMIPTAER
jgi:uncharacterized protein (TIGR03083 family)